MKMAVAAAVAIAAMNNPLQKKHAHFHLCLKGLYVAVYMY